MAYVILILLLMLPQALKASSFFIKSPKNEKMSVFAQEGASKVTYLPARELSSRNLQLPVILVPGLGLRASIYDQTLDGKEGWGRLLSHGQRDVYLLDFPYTEDSGLAPDNPAELSQWSLNRVISKWGIGAEAGEPYENGQFPWDQLQALPSFFSRYYIPAPAGHFANQALAHNIEELLKRTGPAILLVHSAAGEAAMILARERQALIRQLILVEIVGCPGEDISSYPLLQEASTLVLYGDHIEQRGQTARYAACQTMVSQLKERSAEVHWMDLPARGVHGNSHLMMLDRNYAEILVMLNPLLL